MFFVDFLFALSVALLFSLLLIPLAGSRRGTAEGSALGVVAFFFLILFFATWAGGLWLAPFGPPLWGSYWLPFIVMGLLISLLVAVISEPSRRVYPQRPANEPQAERVAEATTFGVFFWILMLMLLLAVAAAYLVR